MFCQTMKAQQVAELRALLCVRAAGSTRTYDRGERDGVCCLLPLPLSRRSVCGAGSPPALCEHPRSGPLRAQPRVRAQHGRRLAASGATRPHCLLCITTGPSVPVNPKQLSQKRMLGGTQQGGAQPGVSCLQGHETVYLLDYAGPAGFAAAVAQEVPSGRVHLLDHHKSAAEQLRGAALPHNLHITLDQSRSGAKIALDHFQPKVGRVWT